jgi:pimeloyl-ACP methyl ester carboxylesterase
MNIKETPNLPVKTIEAGTTTLAYIKQGTGEPVVFIHGALSDYRSWTEQFQALAAAGYRVVSYSRRGHFPNARDAENYTRARHAADLIEFLEALKLEKAHLVGHSYGASVALLAALRKPELVGSLILGEPSPFPELFETDEACELLDEQRAGFEKAMRLLRIGEGKSAVREFLHTVVGIDALCLLPDERRAAVFDNADTLLPMLQSYYDSPAVADGLKTLKIPALFVSGEISPVISRVGNKLLARAVPNSRIAVLKCASHGLQMENPEGFTRLVLDFLAANRNTAPLDEKSLLFSPIFNQKLG